MDLPEKVFLENIRVVFHDCALSRGALRWQNSIVDCGAIEKTALLTIEGADDDIAAPGQTLAAHDLCSRVPAHLRRHVLLPRCGHFSLLYGRRLRDDVLPHIEAFLEDVGPPSH